MATRKYAFLVICLISVFLLPACASKPAPRKTEIDPVSLGRELDSSKEVKTMNERILMSSLASRRAPDRDYRIGPEDLLEVSVFEEEKLNKAVRVSSQGNISLPLIGVLRVKDLTANELEREIRDLLAEKYLQDPHVSVFIKEYRSQRISVIGAVEKPGVFEVTGQKTILDALAMAGGLSGGLKEETAGHLLFLIRPAPADEAAPETKAEANPLPRTFVVDLEDLLVKGDLTLNLPLMNGDVINVPVSGKVYVGGEVRNPGGFPLRGKKMTVGQAVTLAGGLKTEANGSEAKIFRSSERGTERETFSVNVYAIEKGQGEDPVLKENDILIVPKSGMKSFLTEFRETLKGLLGFGVSLGTL